jgi:ribosomal protein S18 acetylase RimI-like enzyme
MAEIVIEADTSVTPNEIMTLHKACGSTNWSLGNEIVWKDCIEQSLCTVSARQEGQLVGVGFLVGNARHAQLVDIVVDPEARGDRVGTRITEALIADAEKRGVRYLGLVRDPNQPWLKSYYESLGFSNIEHAMEFPALQGD